MFLLFVNLYLAMFTGSWVDNSWTDVSFMAKDGLNSVGKLLTSIFGDNVYQTFGNDIIYATDMRNGLISIVSLVLALITSIGIVVMAVKGVKKAFGIFFMGIR